MAKYLVTGGAGFVGSNIVKKLLENKENVRVLDNLSTGKIENIKPYFDKIEFIEGDFTDLEIAKNAVKGIDYVLHQGAIPSVPRSIDDPIKTNNSNILGTLNMLIASRDSGVKRFVYASSSSAYGDSPIMPKVESMNVAPKSPYAIQKLTAEQYCQIFHKIYGLETVCLRYFNVFGPNQDPESVYSAVIPLFIKKMIKGESPIIYGDGNTSRDFTYVDNNIDANLKACSASKKCAGEVINIACGYEMSLNELVEKINKLLKTNIKPIYKEERKGDVKHSLADVAKAKRFLGYEPIISFEDGLQKTIEFYKHHPTP
ncbi:MAG: SDR family oxidoreductase [Candidatus Zambryskibacteria bacterium]|nr:SDR family oxidoreductase [Candidatus Zambryskibacteria bacterium]